MVRETRHLWVGNLPENIREDRIREHFKRYGRVQSVKLLPRGEECPVDGGSSSSLGEGNEGGSGSSSGGGGSGGSSTSGGASATVAFMDIKSAAKAHATEHTLDERALTTQYYEPQHLQHRFPSHGSSEDHGSSGVSGGGSGTSGVSGGGGGGSAGAGIGGGGGGERGERGSESFDSRGSHGSFYGSERSNRVVGTGGSGVVGGGGSGGGGVGVGSHPTDSSTGDPGGYISRGRPPPSSSYHVTSSRARDRLYPRTGPYVSGPPPPPHLDRHRGSLPPSSWSAYEATSSRYGGAPPPPSPATNDAYQDEQGSGGGGGSSSSALRQHKKQRRKSRSGSSSPSGSSRSGSSSSSRSGSSGGSTSGGSTSPGSSPHRTSNVAVTEDRRPLAICVRNLPTRSSDTSLKDGLFHEYKKHGKVTWVKVVGTAGDRYALVCFKKPEDVEKALEVSQDKLFFGCKIEVAPYQGYDVEDNEFRPYEAELDEYHPKATRTLFIGNLEKDVTSSELKKHFEPFGEIIEIDIKKQGAVSSYAFCQYSDIGSVVKAMRSMDGEHLGANRIKLGFGKSMPTSCVWVDGIGDSVSEKYLNIQFHQFGPITQTVIDRERGHALIFFDQINCAQAAVKEMRGTTLSGHRGRRLQVDFASRECQETFYEHLERQGNVNEKTWDSRPSPASSFDVTIPSRRERSSFDSAVTVSSSSSRFTRYDTPPRSRTASYSRTSGSSTPGASPAHPTAMSRSGRRSYQDSYYDGDYSEPASRRFRSYDEFSQGSGASHDDYQSSVLSDGKLNDEDCPPPSRRHAVQSVVTSVDPPAPPPPLLPPPDIRHLQKERVHLLEQLEECHSSGDEVGFPIKKRAKLDSSSTILCEDDEPEIASLLVTSHSTRKGMDFRRVSDSKVVVHHGTRRGSCESRVPGPCKRRRDATSRHHEHHDGSRPGTPLVDERPENLVPSEPRRFRERSHEGPLSLPLPRFAAQMLNNNNNTSSSNNNTGSGTRSSSASLAKVASPPCASLSTAPSPRAAPQPPASPPPRHASSSPTSSDSETAPQSPSLEERIRSLDEKYEKWSGSRALSAAGGDALAKLDASASERFRIRHKLLDLDLRDVKPSDIVKSVLAKRSVFDEDSKRLENFSEKYEPREFTGVIGVSSMIGSTAGLTTSGCTSKVCLQYPFPSHPPVQPTSGTSITSQIGINTSLSASLTPTTTVAPSMLKTDPRIVQHNCIHPTPATPITPGTSIKTVSPELPPVSLPIGLGSGTAASSGNGSGLASASSLLSSNGNLSNIHTLGASTHRGLSVISATTSSPTVTAASTDAFSTAITTTTTTTAVPVTTLSATTSSTATTMTTTSVTISSMTTTSSIAPSSSITSSSNSSSSLLLSTSSTDLPRSRLKKEMSGSGRESRDSRDGKESRESKHGKGKDCQRRSRKEEIDAERNRKEKDERESANIANDIGNADNYHTKDFKDNKDNKELRYERKEREEKERRDKEDRERQERRDKEDRDRQEKKEREERERREKDEERRERERLDKERQEKDRREREERERERKEREENELKEKERREKERIDRERREREEKERQERREREERERREREERERKERELRLEREKQEKERLRREREEQERREKEERDRRREEKERLERERKREREEKERLERERRKEKEERDKLEKEKREKEERERLEKLEKEKHEREKRREREDQERREKEKAEREKRRDREEKDKEKRERDDGRRQSTENHLHPSVTQSQSQVAPAPVPIKRRCSSQDGPDDDGKRIKMSDHRRDSKDRSRQNRRSEDRKHRNDSHRSSRESRESRDSKESGSATQDTRDGTHGESNRENNSKDNGNKEKQRSKKNRSEKESRERSPRVSHESDKEFLSRLELSKRNNSSPSTEQASVGSNHTRDAQHHQQQQSTLNSHSDMDDGHLSTHEIQVARNPSATDTDSDEPKKHSIFDIVDDEPAYISMYDKVKARSTKNMQKLEEEKRQVRLKDKFSQLKQSRARREEKKQSASWDGDSVSSKALTEDEATSESDSTRTKSLSRKGSRSRIHSDTSEEEEPFNNKVRKPVKTERFLESDVDLGFADTEEKQNPLEASNVIVNSVHTNVKEEPRTSDEDERIGFRTNHPAIVNNHERDPRKKSHKKKQKRQKNSISSEDNLKTAPTENLEHKKTNVITSNADCRPNHATELSAATTIVATALDNAEERMRADKKQRSKKEKRRDRNGEDKAKARRKRLNRQEARDSQRMEDIFGPLSDDVDDGPSNTFFNRFNNLTSENSAYASDSDGGRSSLEMDRVRRKTEKKRRHQPEDENSVDLAEAGREIEAKLLSMPSSPKTAPACTESNDHDVFRFTDDNDSVEPSTPSTVPEKVKEKKKKRKKSKEERSRKDYHHHHHHHHHHHEKSGELPYLGAEPSPPRASSPLVPKTISPSLPTPREALLSPIPKVTSNVTTVSSITSPVVSTIQTPKPEKKKDKFIPGFGIEIDETIHENAVKSISEPEERDSSCQSRSGREEPEVPVPTTPPAQNEDKPRVAISQEETEDAVAALLEETFGASTEDFSYENEEEEAEADGVAGASAEAPQEDVEEMQQAVESLNASTVEGDADLKPDTPQSEHDLQIDTDTEEDPNYETVDLTQPPKTPDIPSFYKSPTKTLSMAPVLTAPEKPVEVRLPPTVAKPQSPPSSVIAHSWNLNEHNKPRESIKPVQLDTAESDADVASPERTTQVQRASPSPPPPQYKQPMLVPCSVPITTEVPKTLSAASSRPSPITVQPLYQRLPVSPQSQMVPMRQASPKLQNVTTVSCSSANTPSLPPLVPSRMPPLVPSQPSPRVSQPLSPNGQWSRNPTLSPHVPNVGKRKPSPPPTKIAVCVPIPAHRPEAPVQQIYSTAATQQPVIQHASGMLAPTPGYPRGGLPPLTLNIPPRPYMPVPPLASGIQVKNSRDSSLSGKSVIETLLPVNPNEPPQRLEEPKLSPAVIPEPTNKASTSPKVPSPNQPPTYIPETAKIEINASTSSPVFGKPAYVTDSYTMSSRTQKQMSITTDSNLLSPRQKQEVSNLQLLTTHVPRSSTPSPVIVAHGQSHIIHKSVHTLGPPTVSSPNQPLIKTVVPVVPQQATPNVPSSLPSDKCIIPQTPITCQRQSPVSQSQLVKPHVPLVSTVSQTIITRVVPSTVSSMSTPSMNEQSTPECLETRVIQGEQLELDAEAQITQTVQPMQLTPPIETTQQIDEIKQEPVEVKQEDTADETKYNIIESEKPLSQPCAEDDIKPKQEKQEVIKTEVTPCVPKAEIADVVVPKLETETPIKQEPTNDVKEEDAVKENDEVELDEEPAEDPLKEPSTDPLAIDSKEDPTDSKEDSDYWSAKEVNIESVIKKVDALCDGEGNDGDDETQQADSANSDSHDTSKNESDWFDTESTEGESKKSFVSTEDHDESVETCENESTRSRRGRTKSRRGSRGGVTTRRGGRNASTVSHRRGGRSPRGSKHHVEKNKLPADVYEFHDDSEEDNAGRPRLILTIKSPGPNVTGTNAQPATPVAAVKEVPPEEFVSPAANTRKSRRLAERDGSRNTVDDVIEDVVRGSPVNKLMSTGNVHATRRSTRHNNAPRNTTQQPVMQLTELRKSPRGSRKAARRTSENNDDSGEEKTKEVAAVPQESPNKEEPNLAQPESPKAEESAQAATPASQKPVSLEPMTLIDPVTGMLIPMRESEEGQYIPVSTTSGQAQTTNRTLCESRSGGLISASPTNEAPRAKAVPESSLPAPAEPKKEAIVEHASCQPSQQVQPQTSVITKPQSPAVQVTSTITVAQSSATSTTIVTSATVTATPTTAAAAQPVLTSTSQTKPTSFKAHVLNASKLVTSSQQQQVVITKPAPSLPNQTIVQNIVKPPAQAIQGLNLQIPPGRVVSPSLSPRAKQAAQLASANAKQGQPMSPVLNNTGVPPNPKQHLLQAAKQQTSTIVNMSHKICIADLSPINMHPANVNVTASSPRIHQPVSQPTALKGINGQPHPLNPKTHLLQAAVPIVTGTVAPTQPHLVNPISTGVSNVRLPGPKAPITGTMESQKVEVSMSGCIMVPTASPQSRNVPMPTYEAPLHGSTGATPPGGQYGLVPPHRSQSPPLPPPAHHHSNTSQSEVNHYGGLSRGGELPHYLHPQMLQYQYLRAQQEALTAPRIAYHIPGTRSPHLPLDPKHDTGIEDSHSPPLELRRGTRTPQDRTTDSPQVAQVYMLHAGGVRLPPPPPQYNAGSNPSLPAGARAGYYEPPPAHLRSQYPMAASEAPPEMGRATTPERCRKHQALTPPPPYASQVPPQADSFQMLLQRYPVMWQGLLALKNDQAAVQMHFVFGNPNVARDSLPCNSDGSTPPLRIAQRMRLEQTQVEGVARKMQTDNEHCMLLALPCGRDEVDVLQQSKNLQTGFIMYLQQKQAAGIVNIAAPGSQQPAYVVHIFPSCDFAHENLARIAPDLLHRVAKIAHLLIVIATV